MAFCKEGNICTGASEKTVKQHLLYLFFLNLLLLFCFFYLILLLFAERLSLGAFQLHAGRGHFLLQLCHLLADGRLLQLLLRQSLLRRVGRCTRLRFSSRNQG